MTAIVKQLAKYIAGAGYDSISEDGRLALKVRVLDSLGTAIGAVEGEPIRRIRKYIDDFGGKPVCTLIGGGKTSPDRAAFYNGGLIRYLDSNDSYLAKGETCHPSDNIGAVLAAAEHAGRGGRDFLTAVAVAYQVQTRLSDEAPVRAKGFDHTTQGVYGAAAGVAKALGLDVDSTADALAIAGTAFNALRVTRTGALSHWKGLAAPNAAFAATHAAYLAGYGITGPAEVFEGNKGFMDTIAGSFHIDWGKEGLESVTRTIIKKYNAEIHSQSALEGLLELRDRFNIDPFDVASIDLETFDVAYNIIGGGEEGDKTIVRTKEEADHSLHYMMAVALLDGTVMPDQYKPGRILREDVQNLLRKVRVRESSAFSARFPAEMPCAVTVTMDSGGKYVTEKRDYEGFVTRPMPWESVVRKFNDLSRRYASESLREQIVETAEKLETIRVADLMRLLEQVEIPGEG
jgi:2-methylcitrate dehydratase